MGTAKWSDLNYEVAIFKTFEEIKLVENKAAAVAEFLKKDKAAFDIQNNQKCNKLAIKLSLLI